MLKNLKYLRIFLRIFLWPIYWFSGFFPRNKKIWAFGEDYNGFMGNPKYLFYYVNESCFDIKAVWITDNKNLIKKLQGEGYSAFLRGSLKGIFYCLRAGVYIYASIPANINFYLSRGSLWLNLWHGIPLKKIGFYDIKIGKRKKFNLKYRFAYKLVLPWIFKKPDFFLSTSSYVSNLFSKIFEIDFVSCIELGYPRNDILFWDKEKLTEFIRKNSSELFMILQKMGKFENTVIYMPTYRENATNDISKIVDLRKMNIAFKKLNSFLIIKQHPSIEVKFNNCFSNILFLDNKIDVYPLFPFTNALITGYSSVMFDYLLVNKPILLFTYDKDYYSKNERDFYFCIDDYFPYASVYNLDDLLKKIKLVLIKNIKTNQPIQEMALKVFHRHVDGDASKRITLFLLEKLRHKL